VKAKHAVILSVVYILVSVVAWVLPDPWRIVSLLVVVLMMGGLIWFTVARRVLIHGSLWERRWRDGLCLRCGYPLRGNISGVCPECGEKIRPD
jgi:hypothetical protein